MTKPEVTTYPVSGTTMTLTITSNPASTLSQADVTQYLSNALLIAEANDKSTLLEKVFRIEESSIKFIFAISPPLFWDSELTWGDVVCVVSSLLDYFKQSGVCVEVGFEIGDMETGELGLGSGRVGKIRNLILQVYIIENFLLPMNGLLNMGWVLLSDFRGEIAVGIC